MQFYSATKNKIMSVTRKWVEGFIIMLNDVRRVQRNMTRFLSQAEYRFL